MKGEEPKQIELISGENRIDSQRSLIYFNCQPQINGPGVQRVSRQRTLDGLGISPLTRVTGPSIVPAPVPGSAFASLSLEGKVN